MSDFIDDAIGCAVWVFVVWLVILGVGAIVTWWPL